MNAIFLITIDLVLLTKALIVALGLIVILLDLIAIVRAAGARKWKKTDGIIEESTVTNFGTSGDSERFYKPKIKYKYVVDGKEFVSWRVYFGSNLMGLLKKRRSLKTVRKYTAGNRYTIFYNPRKKNMSVIEPGIKSELAITFFVGLIIAFVGFMLIVNLEFFGIIGI